MGETLLEVVVARALLAKNLTGVVVATSDNQLDDEVLDWCQERGVRCFRGSESDVLSRYADAASVLRADWIVRITADDPFKDPLEIDELVEIAALSNRHYVSNNQSEEIPEGMDLEVFSYDLLQECNLSAKRKFEREHVTPWMRERHPESPGILSAERYKDWPNVRLTVDVPEDLQFSRCVYEDLAGGSRHSTQALLSHILKNPELSSLNAGAVERYAGLKKSMQEERNET